MHPPSPEPPPSDGPTTRRGRAAERQTVAIDPAEISGEATYRLLTSLVVPRPIAWVGTVDADGVPNLAPHSYFNIVSHDPPVVHWTSGGVKDSLRNARATGEFVVSIVDMALLEAMNLTAADFPAGVDEGAWADVATVASATVRPPRVACAPAALECRVRQELAIGSGVMVFGDVLRVWVDPRVLDPAADHAAALPERLRAVGRLGGSAYVDTADPVRLDHLDRPRWRDLQPAEDDPPPGP